MWCRRVLPATLPAPLSATLSPALWVYPCKCGAAGSASARTACAICPTLRQSQSPPQTRKSSPPRCPSLPLLPVWMNVYFLFPWCWSPPCCSILCQFWLCEEAQFVYLCRHLGSPNGIVFLLSLSGTGESHSPNKPLIPLFLLCLPTSPMATAGLLAVSMVVPFRTVRYLE